MEQRIKIIQAETDDLDEILEIEQSSFNSPWSRELFLNDFNNEFSHIYIARNIKGGRLCGYICFTLLLGELHITNLAVGKKYRRKGIAKRLMRFTFDFAKERGGTVAFLEVRESHDAAKALYKMTGFFEVARRKKYYSDTGEDAVIMINFMKGSL